MDKVKNWEDTELSHQSATEKPSLSPQKRLAPLNADGPIALLQRQIEDLQAENGTLRQRLKTVEGQATSALTAKDEANKEMARIKQADRAESQQNSASSKELEEVTNKNHLKTLS